MIDTIATVERNGLVSTASSRRYGLLRVRIESRLEILPGQFAMLKPHDGFEPLLRRAMAYYRSEDGGEGVSAEFIYQVLGRGTQMLSKLEPGDKVDFLGSLGNTWDIDAARGREALLVAGGVGSAAVYMLAEALVSRGNPTRLFIGGAGSGDLCGLDDFVSLLGAGNVITATVDGSLGEKGFVTGPLERFLDSGAGGDAIIYACGPDPMLHRVSQIAEAHGLPAQLSLESPMACGFGICVGCAVAVRDESPEGFGYKKVCTDGPVFWSRDLHW